MEEGEDFALTVEKAKERIKELPWNIVVLKIAHQFRSLVAVRILY